VGGRSEGDDEEDPPATPGDQAAARERVLRNWTTPVMARSTSSTDVGLPDAEHHGNVVWAKPATEMTAL
jgi:hypothetical protein